MRGKPSKLKSPKIEREKWWEVYPSMNSAKFTVELSGRVARMVDPYEYTCGDNGNMYLKPSRYGNDIGFKPVGYTTDPPMLDGIWKDDKYVVAIMYEAENGKQVWFHYPQ